MPGSQFDLFEKSSNTILEAPDYRSFKKLLEESGCRKCDLSKTRNAIVVDRGNPESSVMAIGEAPGEQEDLQGKAFVGRAGQLMDRLMGEAGIDTNRHLLIANIVKCRPPKNRAPRPPETESCIPYLRKQMALVRPHTILLLGSVAVRHMFRRRGVITMKDEVGRLFTSPDFPGLRFMILYHPAYLLRDPRKQPDFMKHLALIKTRLAR